MFSLVQVLCVNFDVFFQNKTATLKRSFLCPFEFQPSFYNVAYGGHLEKLLQDVQCWLNRTFITIINLQQFGNYQFDCSIKTVTKCHLQISSKHYDPIFTFITT